MTDTPINAETTHESENEAEMQLAAYGATMLDNIAYTTRIESYGFDATTDEAMVKLFNAAMSLALRTS